MTLERRRRLLRLARIRGDRLAIATLTADRRWTPEPPDYQILTGLWLARKAA